MSFKLPAGGTGGIISGHTIFFHCFQKYTDHTSTNGGTIQLLCQSDQEVRSTSHDDPHIEVITTGLGGKSKFKDVNRNSFAAHFFISGSDKYWFLRSLMYRPEDSLVQQITTNKTYFKHFENDEAGYQTGTIFLLPSGYHTYIVNYGDGTNFGNGSGGTGVSLGVNVALPAEPVDGTKVLLHSSVHRQTSSSTDCITLNFPGGVSGYSTRRISAAGTATAASVGRNLVCPASSDHSKNHTYIYSSASDVWVQLVDKN